LRWLLVKDKVARDRLLGVFLPEGKPPWRVENMNKEFKVARHRADLRFDATDATGHETMVLLETKVNDDLKQPQIEAYCGTPAEVIIYGPGLTGLLHSGGDPIGRERWITGRQVTHVLKDHLSSLPDLIRSYLAGVAGQADRMDAARQAARGGPDFDRADDISEVNADDVEAVAWVAEVAAALRALGADGIKPRNTRHDYGVFWAGSWRELDAGRDLGFYIDVLAAHEGWEYVIAIKIGGGDGDDRGRAFNAAMEAGPPWEGWISGRRSRAETFRVWKLDAGSMTPPQAADAALRARAYIDALVEGGS